MSTPIHQEEVGPFVASYRHQEEFEDIYREVFIDEEYAFDTLEDAPRILDAGSHIGLSILYFKMRYPRSRIVAFEPNPHNFALLEKNVSDNRLEGVTCVHAALADHDGSIDLYGDFAVPEAKTWGNTLIPNMWGQGRYDRKITVPARRLSSYLAEPADFLKLDIEGAEQMVVDEIAPHLGVVSELRLEYHTPASHGERNELEAVVGRLRASQLEVEVETKEALDGHFFIRARQKS